jgi:hypothetical protein
MKANSSESEREGLDLFHLEVVVARKVVLGLIGLVLDVAREAVDVAEVGDTSVV